MQACIGGYLLLPDGVKAQCDVALDHPFCVLTSLPHGMQQKPSPTRRKCDCHTEANRPAAAKAVQQRFVGSEERVDGPQRSTAPMHFVGLPAVPGTAKDGT